MHWGSYYLFWLAAPAAIALVSAHPLVLVVVVIGLVARRWLPDPYLYFKHAGRIRSLRGQIEVNPHNASAQRELALIYLEKRRPAKAISLIEGALRRDPDSAELLYLHGLALLGDGRWEPALVPLEAAIRKEPRLRYGEPYLRAGDALVKLDRLEQAQAAYEQNVAINNSTVEGRTKLGLVRSARRDAPGAAQAFADARATYRQLPGFRRRHEWRWALRAWWA